MRRVRVTVLLASLALAACPAKTTAPASTRRISAGSLQTCALDNGTVRCWGPRGRDSRKAVTATDDATQVASGMFVSCAIKSDGAVTCFDPGFTTPPKFGVGIADALQLSVGWGKGCAVRKDRTVSCWEAMLDYPVRDRAAKPVPGLKDVNAVAVGMSSACALKRDGSVWCWETIAGDDLREPPKRVDGIEGAVEIAAGTYSACARIRDSSVRCWGTLPSGQADAPVTINDWAGAAQLALNSGCNAGQLACARLEDGRVRCMGDSTFGANGDGTRKPRQTPVDVKGLTDAAHVAAGCSHVCAVRTTGQIVCWGEGETLGFGKDNDQLIPAPARDDPG